MISTHGRQSGSRLTSQLLQAIRTQPEMIASFARRSYARELKLLDGCSRIILVGTGTSMHAAELGEAMLSSPDRPAVAISAQQFCYRDFKLWADDVLIAITHTGQTAYVRRCIRMAQRKGTTVIAITGMGAGIPEAIETVPLEQSETYSVSYLASLMVLARLAHGLGTSGLNEQHLIDCGQAIRIAIADTNDISAMSVPARSLALVGTGLSEVTAREGALKVREASRMIAVGYDAELFLHGSAVPYHHDDAIIFLGDDKDGFVDALELAACAEKVPTYRLRAPFVDGHPVLEQFVLTGKLQVLAEHFAKQRGHDPDVVISGAWAADSLWDIGSP